MKNLKYLIILCISASFIPAQAQSVQVTVSGIVRDSSRQLLPYVNVVLKAQKDSTFITGGISDESGRFTLSNIQAGDYFIELSFIGYNTYSRPVVIGNMSNFLDFGDIILSKEQKVIGKAVIAGKRNDIDEKMDKKSFTVQDNISQSGGSALGMMKTLPGITIGDDGKVQLRGSDKVVVLIDGKQTALTGFGSQSGLDNIPASAIERIEIINNPSAKYDANGNAGIINIILKKEKKKGFNGKAGLTGGLGALWIKKDNYPGIRPQYQNTPKINPSLSLNYRKNKVNYFFQGDYLYTQTLNKNEFTERTYDSAATIRQQLKRNRNTGTGTVKAGFDWNINERNNFSLSALFSSERIIDRGDEPFFNDSLNERKRLWQFLEDEIKTTVTASAAYQYKFAQPGRILNIGFNYTFHREDEKYFFTNIMPSYTGYDAFKLLSDEQVGDLTADYTRPLKYGRFEGGVKLRKRYIPTNMQFMPGLNSPLDTNAGGWANYNELIPAVYGNYLLENKKFQLEAGLRIEYVRLDYTVNPEHNTYKSNGYSYSQPFPNLRLAYKISERQKISFFYNRRVDRPNEVDIRIFPKYDDAEIIKVGNPGLRPQFTNLFELAYKTGSDAAYIYAAAYHKITDASITRIATTQSGSTLIYNVFENAGRSYNSGFELMLSKSIRKSLKLNLNVNAYQNRINPFTVKILYPAPVYYSASGQEMFSGNVKFNGLFHFKKLYDVQLTAIYLAPDIIPQGKTGSRFSLDIGVKRMVQKGKGELFLNASDIANTMVIKKEISGSGFRYTSTDYYETQVIRAGYNYKF